MGRGHWEEEIIQDDKANILVHLCGTVTGQRDALGNLPTRSAKG